MSSIKWDDGTPFDPPKDPLEEKWAKLYPSCSETWDYSCIFCDKCPYGDEWKIPEEDKEVWKQHQAEVEAYAAEHGGWEHLVLTINSIADEEGEDGI